MSAALEPAAGLGAEGDADLFATACSQFHGFDEVLASAERLDVSLRTAALMFPVRRVAEAAKLRAIHP